MSYIGQSIKVSTNNVQLHLINGRNNLFASWETEKYEYRIYHDSAGSSNIGFNISTEEISKVDHPFIMKKVNSMDTALLIASQSLGKEFGNTTFWRGRPDIIVEVYSKVTRLLSKVIIGEVKNTKNIDYAITGLRELVEYIELVKGKDGCYLKETDIEVEGMLFLGNIAVKNVETEHINIQSLSHKNMVKLNISL
ncbi:hypothetical protein [Sutcliffiella sp. NC1]|uniref:hypothetical protein n=1 Tax=Sutcliffiella sp. NC1 TaxID=3004096 RepID=UPI0022DD4613|nr:hypothetical protein [Sutcliffiella sp. NC1]WBL16879.1 hypothetical protein O1A01_09690 [Sutcliffiella sp. NC1]